MGIASLCKQCCCLVASKGEDDVEKNDTSDVKIDETEVEDTFDESAEPEKKLEVFFKEISFKLDENEDAPKTSAKSPDEALMESDTSLDVTENEIRKSVCDIDDELSLEENLLSDEETRAYK
eukprot:CAMPEP_0196137734 /NCGR_PEP_ID=MMETSP0910-20130528/5628_1 /TAXON_ID=49265 /ORGANISM="Thalassiosira rotula, Strain GSO102" /LENGTH=121 /DNA_ID=CAMNT_0041398237 /DNA_START=116 /DNA_END=481 /DNA_ORIENTATION=-